MKYGLPYKGSKNKLAERIVRLLPRRTNLVDLFCGGCAVSHAALLMGKFKNIYINDINWMCPTLFMDALQGKYANDTRWISREDFFRLRDTDPYVAMVWSFGNNMRDYLYSKEIEPLKKAIHYALFFSDYSLAKALEHDLSFVDAIKDVQQRYRSVRQYFSQTPPVFISSYQMPTDRFDCIAEYSHRSTLNDKKNNAVTERIFVPKHQTERGNICQQLTLPLF